MKPRPWSDSEVDTLRRFYAAAGSGPVKLTRLAALLGRNKGNVCRKAGALGLANARRAKSAQMRLPAGHSRPGDPERRAMAGRSTRRHITANGHPRGMLGKKAHRGDATAALRGFAPHVGQPGVGAQF